MSEEKKTYEEKEKAEGIWAETGESTKFNRVFSGHRFTDEEVTALLNGEEIEVTDLKSKKGTDFGAVLKLENQTYNGNRFVGAAIVRYIERIPDSWCKYQFSAAEKTRLMAGNSVTVKGAISSKGNKFNCNVRYGKKQDGTTGIYIDTSI